MQLPWHPRVIMVQQQGSLWAIAKPCGLLSHPNRSGIYSNSVLTLPYDFKAEAYICNDGPVYLLNRLDSPTSGIMLLCTEEKLTRAIRNLFRTHQVQKVYQAIVKGRFPTYTVCWEDALTTTHEQGHLRTQATSHGPHRAKTQVRLLKTFSRNQEHFSWIELYPLTGRTHQLRVQCAKHHFPILGDKVYGNFACNCKWKTTRLYLHSYRISFDTSQGHFEAHCDAVFNDFLDPSLPKLE